MLHPSSIWSGSLGLGNTIPQEHFRWAGLVQSAKILIYYVKLCAVPQLGPSKTSDEGHVLDVPLVILSPGFLVSKRMYFDYAERLASFGFAVLKWEPVGEEFPFWVDTHRVCCPHCGSCIKFSPLRGKRHTHTASHGTCAAIANCDMNVLLPQTLAHFVQQMWLWAREKSQDSSSPLFQTFNASSGLMLVGHSRGAKINSLAAAWYPQDVRGIVNIDPVDSLPPFVRTNSQDYPSALPLMVGLSTPVLNVGSQLGNSSRLFSPPCAPSEGNYEAFFNHANRAWLLEILESGHMQFLGDDGEGGCIRCDMLRAACERGGQTDLLVRSLTMTAMTAWLSRCAGRPGEIGLYVMYWTELLKLQGLATSRYKEKMVGDNQSLDLAKEESGWQGKVEGTGLKRL